jgi:hypothetical protein
MSSAHSDIQISDQDRSRRNPHSVSRAHSLLLENHDFTDTPLPVTDFTRTSDTKPASGERTHLLLKDHAFRRSSAFDGQVRFLHPVLERCGFGRELRQRLELASLEVCEARPDLRELHWRPNASIDQVLGSGDLTAGTGNLVGQA